MDQVRVFYDREGETLTVWFDDPRKESVVEETGDKVLLIKDRDGKVIGFEKLHFRIANPDRLNVALETVRA